MKLQVFALKASGHYGGGMAIVAAVDQAQAKVYATGIDSEWRTRYDKPDSVEILPYEDDGPPRVVVHYETGE